MISNKLMVDIISISFTVIVVLMIHYVALRDTYRNIKESNYKIIAVICLTLQVIGLVIGILAVIRQSDGLMTLYVGIVLISFAVNYVIKTGGRQDAR